MRGASYQPDELPPYMREWQLLRMGLTLKDLGYDELPAVMGDWLLQMEAVYMHEKAKAMNDGG